MKKTAIVVVFAVFFGLSAGHGDSLGKMLNFTNTTGYRIDSKDELYSYISEYVVPYWLKLIVAKPVVVTNLELIRGESNQQSRKCDVVHGECKTTADSFLLDLTSNYLRFRFSKDALRLGGKSNFNALIDQFSQDFFSKPVTGNPINLIYVGRENQTQKMKFSQQGWYNHIYVEWDDEHLDFVVLLERGLSEELGYEPTRNSPGFDAGIGMFRRMKDSLRGKSRRSKLGK